MCKKSEANKNDMILFQKVKETMLSVCESYSDSIEYQIFKEKLEKATSFRDLLK